MKNMHFDTIDSFLNYDFNRKNGAPTYQICYQILGDKIILPAWIGIKQV